MRSDTFFLHLLLRPRAHSECLSSGPLPPPRPLPGTRCLQRAARLPRPLRALAHTPGSQTACSGHTHRYNVSPPATSPLHPRPLPVPPYHLPRSAGDVLTSLLSGSPTRKKAQSDEEFRLLNHRCNPVPRIGSSTSSAVNEYLSNELKNTDYRGEVS